MKFFLIQLSSQQRSIRRLLFSSAAGSSPPPQFKHKTGSVTCRSEFTSTNGRGCLVYGRESHTGSLQLQVVNALRAGDRAKASNLLSNFVQKSYMLRVDDFVKILQYCAQSPDPLFVMETWRSMEERQVSMTSKCHFLIIRALCKGGYIEQACSLMNTFRENSGVFPILPIYNCLLGACVKMHSLNHANYCLDYMEDGLLGKNEVTYAELLKLAVSQHNLWAVHKIWIECRKHYSQSIISLRKFIWSFTCLGDLKTAFEVLQQLVSLAFREGFVLTTTAEGKFSNFRLDIPVPNKGENYKEVDTQASSIELSTSNSWKTTEPRSAGMHLAGKYPIGPAMKVLRWSFGDMIHACAKARNYELAEQLFSQMRSLGVEPSSSTYDGFIRALLWNRNFREGIDWLEYMCQKNLKPHDSTIAAISISCSKAFELDLAEAFLDQIDKPSLPHAHNAFLESCCILDQPERAVRILGRMKKLKLQPNIRTYELLFSLFGNVNAPYENGNMLSQLEAARRIKAIEEDMLKRGIDHSFLSIKNLLKAFGSEGMLRELIHYLRLAETQFSQSNSFPASPIYNTVLHSLIEARESETAVKVFKTIVSRGYRRDAATYTVMIDCCSIIRCSKSASALLSMMIRDGFHPLVTTYTALVKSMLTCGDFDQALSLVNQGLSDGITPDAALFNAVIHSSCKMGRIDMIEHMVEQMHRVNVKPDPATCGYVFTAYVNSGFFNTAMEALQVLCMRMISEEEISTEENRTTLEDYIFAEKSEAESRAVEFFKDFNESLAFALLNLRWCAILGSSISWLPNQSEWAKRLSSTYSYRASAACKWNTVNSV